MCITYLILVNDKINQILESLSKDESGKSLPVQGFLRNVLYNSLPYDVFLDKWPDYNVIIIRPKSHKQKLLPLYNVYVYSTNVKSLSNVLPHSGVLSQDFVTRIYGLSVDLLPTLQDYCKEKHVELHTLQIKAAAAHDKCATCLKVPYNEQLRLDIGSYLTSYYSAPLDGDKHAHIVAYDSTDSTGDEHTWQFDSKEEYKSALKYFIKTNPSVGIFTKSDNLLVSWCITSTELAVFSCNTVPDHRNQGLHKWCLLELSNTLTKDPKYGGDFSLLTYVSRLNDEFRILKSLDKSKALEVFDNECYHCVALPGNEDDAVSDMED